MYMVVISWFVYLTVSWTKKFSLIWLFSWSVYCSYLLILDRTNWKTNILTSLLIPYIFFSLPSVIFSAFRWLAYHTSLSWALYLQYQSSLFLIMLVFCMFAQGRVWEMDSFYCCCATTFLSKAFPWYSMILLRLILALVVYNVRIRGVLGVFASFLLLFYWT